MIVTVHPTVPPVDFKTEMLYLLLGDLLMKNLVSLRSSSPELQEKININLFYNILYSQSLVANYQFFQVKDNM